MTEQIITSTITCILSIVIGWIAATLKQMRRKKTEEDSADKEWKIAMGNGMRSILRNDLVKTHREYVVHKGSCPLVVKEITERNYVAYHDLKGNGTAAKLFQDIMELPINENT